MPTTESLPIASVCDSCNGSLNNDGAFECFNCCRLMCRSCVSSHQCKSHEERPNAE